MEGWEVELNLPSEGVQERRWGGGNVAPVSVWCCSLLEWRVGNCKCMEDGGVMLSCEWMEDGRVTLRCEWMEDGGVMLSCKCMEDGRVTLSCKCMEDGRVTLSCKLYGR